MEDKMEKKDLELKMQELKKQEQMLVANLNAIKGAIQVTQEYINNWDKKVPKEKVNEN
jgi:hypothetical protein